MSLNKFEYGPFSRAIFIGLLWCTVILGFTAPNLLIYHIPLLFFLGFGLRPLIEKSGVITLYEHIAVSFDEWSHRKFIHKRGQEIDRKVRDDKYRKKRRKDPKLPKNW